MEVLELNAHIGTATAPQNVRMAPLDVLWIACFRNSQYGAYKTSHVMLIRNAVTRISAPLQPLTVLPTEFSVDVRLPFRR
jgi:hypothetical protein